MAKARTEIVYLKHWYKVTSNVIQQIEKVWPEDDEYRELLSHVESFQFYVLSLLGERLAKKAVTK